MCLELETIIETYGESEDKIRFLTTLRSKIDKLINLHCNPLSKQKVSTNQSTKVDKFFQRNQTLKCAKKSTLCDIVIHGTSSSKYNEDLTEFFKRIDLPNIKPKNPTRLGKHREFIPVKITVTNQEKHQIYKNCHKLKKHSPQQFYVSDNLTKDEMIQKRMMWNAYMLLKKKGHKCHFRKATLYCDGKKVEENNLDSSKSYLNEQTEMHPKNKLEPNDGLQDQGQINAVCIEQMKSTYEATSQNDHPIKLNDAKLQMTTVSKPKKDRPKSKLPLPPEKNSLYEESCQLQCLEEENQSFNCIQEMPKDELAKTLNQKRKAPQPPKLEIMQPNAEQNTWRRNSSNSGTSSTTGSIRSETRIKRLFKNLF